MSLTIPGLKTDTSSSPGERPQSAAAAAKMAATGDRREKTEFLEEELPNCCCTNFAGAPAAELGGERKRSELIL